MNFNCSCLTLSDTNLIYLAYGSTRSRTLHTQNLKRKLDDHSPESAAPSCNPNDPEPGPDDIDRLLQAQLDACEIDLFYTQEELRLSKGRFIKEKEEFKKITDILMDKISSLKQAPDQRPLAWNSIVALLCLYSFLFH